MNSSAPGCNRAHRGHPAVRNGDCSRRTRLRMLRMGHTMRELPTRKRRLGSCGSGSSLRRLSAGKNSLSGPPRSRHSESSAGLAQSAASKRKRVPQNAHRVRLPLRVSSSRARNWNCHRRWVSLDDGFYDLVMVGGRTRGLHGFIGGSYGGDGHAFRERLRRGSSQGMEKVTPRPSRESFGAISGDASNPMTSGRNEKKLLLD